MQPSRAGRWRKLQPESFPDFNHARNVLLLLRTKRADFLEETLEARRRDDAHEPARRLAKVTVSVRDAAWSKNRGPLLRDERLLTNGPLVYAFEDLKCLILAAMDMWRRATAWHVVGKASKTRLELRTGACLLNR
jgi:hypothetical protein